MKNYYIFFNKNYVRQSDANIPVLSSSSQFGLNVFEGIRVYKEDFFYIFRLKDHLKRLNNSLNLSYGDFGSYKNDNSSNGSNYSFGIDNLQKDLTLSFFYYYFNAKGSSNLDDDGVVFSISKKTSF